MAYTSLREFVEALDRAGELHRVKAKVSPLLEIAEIADRVSKSPAAQASEHARAFDPHHFGAGGKALLFENVEGAATPVLITTRPWLAKSMVSRCAGRPSWVMTLTSRTTPAPHCGRLG